MKVTVARVLTALWAFLFKISTVSPTFKLALSAFSNKTIWLLLKLSISYLDLTLYFHVLNANSLKFLFLFKIFSPRFLTETKSSSNNNPNLDLSLISERTPVILNSTFLLESPSSYPNIIWSERISSVGLITAVTPVQSKNWLTFLLP